MYSPAGLMPVQLRFKTGLTGEQYVTREFWRKARLERCPLHPAGGCGFARHGTYQRKTPRGTHVARWYCPQGHSTFSLLPDHLAARFPGALSQIEAVVAATEGASSLQACANALRPDPVGLPGALRWVRRRLTVVRSLLAIVVPMVPQLLQGCTPTITEVRVRLGVDFALVALRDLMSEHLAALAAPLGFGHRRLRGGDAAGALQQHKGPDPPARWP